jgi:ubiquinone/menaquinone biosynthesis C-methylase UbiE
VLKKIRSFLMAKSYDFVMQGTEQRCLGAWRKQILAAASGDLLEIGAGTGVNLAYIPEQTSTLYLCEPDQQMRNQLIKKAARSTRKKIVITDWKAEAIAMPSESFDTIVSTLVLCSVGSLNASIRESHRLLRPGGILIFMEHIIAKQPATRAWQKRIEPYWGLCAGDCRLTRDTARAITDNGFQIEEITEEKMIGAPAFVNRTIRGRARKTTGNPTDKCDE